MDRQENNKLFGTVVYLRTNVGSKNECVVPFLYQGREVGITRMMLKDDNPFENNGLLPYDGQAVEVSGTLANGGTFIADVVRKLKSSDRSDDSAAENNI